MAVGYVWQQVDGDGGAVDSRHRRDTLHLAVRARGEHPALGVCLRTSRLSSRDRTRVRATGHLPFDRRFRMLADDGAHAAAVARWSVLDRLAADPSGTSWVLRGRWSTCHRAGPLTPDQLELLLAWAGGLAVDREAVPRDA